MSARALRIGLLGARWGPGPGGVETVLATLSSELLRRGHDVAALVLETDELAEGEEADRRQGGVAVRRIGWRYESQLELLDLIRTPALEEAAARWSAEAGLDLVHVHHLSGWGLGVPRRLRELRVPVLWTLHDYWPLCPRGQLFAREGESCEAAIPERCGACWAGTWPQLRAPRDPEAVVAERLVTAHEAFDACAALLVPSVAAREWYARLGVDPSRLVVCENGVEVPARVEVVPPPEGAPLRVGYLGAVQPSKGVLELARLVDELRGPLTLEVHGPLESYHGDRSCVDALERLASSSERVHLHGPYVRAELSRILPRLQGVAAPSLWPETHGLGAREARAAGLPVFASRLGGLDDPAFHLLPAGEDEPWRAALERFATDPAWRAELCARPYAPRSRKGMVDQLEALYLGLA